MLPARLLLLAAVMLAPAAAFAADNQPAAKGPTLQQCQDMRQALRALDGYQGVDKDGKSAPMQYKLGNLRVSIATDEHALDEIIQTHDAARVALIKELLPGGTPPIGTPEYTKFISSDPGFLKFSTDWQKVLDTPQNIMLTHIRLSDLNVGDPPDHNPIPPDVLNALWPILDQ